MPTPSNTVWLDSQRHLQETPPTPAQLTQRRGFFEAVAHLEARQTPATRADVDALREEVRQLRAEIAQYSRLVGKGG